MRSRHVWLGLVIAAALAGAACSSSDDDPLLADGGPSKDASADAKVGQDASPRDSATTDATPDSGRTDATSDASVPDSAPDASDAAADGPRPDASDGAASDSGASDATADASPDAGDASTDASTPDATSDASTDASTADADAGACNALTNLGGVISKTANAGAAPALTGGTVVAGTYVLTGVVKYNTTNAGTTTSKETLLLDAPGIQSVGSTNGAADGRAAGTFTTVGAGITITVTCPSTNVVTGTYAATTTQFQLSTDPNEIRTYTKQ